jgi:flagellar biogenesis protein FliO
MLKAKLFVLLFVCCMQGIPAAAEQDPSLEERIFEERVNDEDPALHQVSDVRALFFKTFGLLAGLCGLVIVGGYALKRIGGPRGSALGAGGAITLIERKYISPKTVVWLVNVNDQPLVVVDSQNGVAIHTLNPTQPTQQVL